LRTSLFAEAVFQPDGADPIKWILHEHLHRKLGVGEKLKSVHDPGRALETDNRRRIREHADAKETRADQTGPVLQRQGIRAARPWCKLDAKRAAVRRHVDRMTIPYLVAARDHGNEPKRVGCAEGSHKRHGFDGRRLGLVLNPGAADRAIRVRSENSPRAANGIDSAGSVR
jgi:hypothetical protein